MTDDTATRERQRELHRRHLNDRPVSKLTDAELGTLELILSNLSPLLRGSEHDQAAQGLLDLIGREQSERFVREVDAR